MPASNMPAVFFIAGIQHAGQVKKQMNTAEIYMSSLHNRHKRRGPKALHVSPSTQSKANTY